MIFRWNYFQNELSNCEELKLWHRAIEGFHSLFYSTSQGGAVAAGALVASTCLISGTLIRYLAKQVSTCFQIFGIDVIPYRSHDIPTTSFPYHHKNEGSPGVKPEKQKAGKNKWLCYLPFHSSVKHQTYLCYDTETKSGLTVLWQLPHSLESAEETFN